MTTHKADGAGMDQASRTTFVPCDCGCGRSCCAYCGTDVGFVSDMHWRPMESAPKDGTLIILKIRWSDVPVVARWEKGTIWSGWEAPTEHYTVSCGTYCYGGTPSHDKLDPEGWFPMPSLDWATR